MSKNLEDIISKDIDNKYLFQLVSVKGLIEIGWTELPDKDELNTDSIDILDIGN